MVCGFCEEYIATLPAGYQEALVGGFTGAVLATLGILAVLFGIALYVYHALAWMKIAKRMKHKYPWLAWIPFAASAMRLQLGKFHWAWIFLVLIPIVGWVALIVLLSISIWRIFEKQKYPGWISLSFPAMFVPRISGIGTIAYMIIIGFVAWKKK
jgi:hypothetical protein